MRHRIFENTLACPLLSYGHCQVLCRIVASALHIITNSGKNLRYDLSTHGDSVATTKLSIRHRSYASFAVVICAGVRPSIACCKRNNWMRISNCASNDPATVIKRFSTILGASYSNRCCTIVREPLANHCQTSVPRQRPPLVKRMCLLSRSVTVCFTPAKPRLFRRSINVLP